MQWTLQKGFQARGPVVWWRHPNSVGSKLLIRKIANPLLGGSIDSAQQY